MHNGPAIGQSVVAGWLVGSLVSWGRGRGRAYCYCRFSRMAFEWTSWKASEMLVQIWTAWASLLH